MNYEQPKVKPGDTVECRVPYYTWYDSGDQAIIQEVGYSVKGTPLIYLSNPYSETGYTGYKASNWSKVEPKEKPMANAYERKTYYAHQINELGHPIHGRFTEHFNLKSDCIKRVQELIDENEQWMVVETVCLIKPAKPQPPIVITEYK